MLELVPTGPVVRLECGSPNVSAYQWNHSTMGGYIMRESAHIKSFLHNQHALCHL